jgi:hypothetical protein
LNVDAAFRRNVHIGCTSRAGTPYADSHRAIGGGGRPAFHSPVMKLNDTFKIAWWVIPLLFVSSLLVLRYSAIAAGTSSTTDVFVLLLWIGLMLVPIAKELNPSGPKLKQSIESLKDQVQNLMFTVQNQTQSVSINNYPIPPSDNEISRRQKEAEEILGTGKRSGIRSLQDEAIPQDAEMN